MYVTTKKGLKYDPNKVKRETSPDSAAAGHCVWIAFIPGGTLVGDSKDPEKTPLDFTEAEWTAFVSGITGDSGFGHRPS